jgi:ADP-heptose:LPS heptosyltransferase
VHISKQFVSLAASLESKSVPNIKRQLESNNYSLSPIPIDKQKFRKWRRQFESDFPAIVGDKLIVLYPSGGLLPIRAWPLENYCAVAKDFINNGYAVGILGLNDDKQIADEIISNSEHNKCIDLTGYTKNICELLYIFHYSILLIANDGGPSHFASLTQIPTVIIYGPETPVLYASLSENAANIYNTFSCSPCLTAYNHRHSPCDGDNVCLKIITVTEVLERSYGIISRERKTISNSI